MFTKNKTCMKCKKLLPGVFFTSARAKYCNPCLVIHKLEKRNEMTLRSLNRSKVKKQKTVGIIRISDLKKEVQKVVNKYVRLRDAELGCISCSTGKCDEAGHFWPMGANGALRYDTDNLHGQCTSCNRWRHGNLLEYRLALVKKIGDMRVMYLDDHHHDIKKWEREELEEIRATYTQKIKEMLK